MLSPPDAHVLQAQPRFWARRGFAIAWIAGVLLSLPALRVGALNDDFFQHLVLDGSIPLPHLGPTTLYDFTGGHDVVPWIELGYLPWESHPALSLRFFRPLASLSIALDHTLFGRAQLPGHLVNLAWFLALVGVAIAWFKELLPKPQAGLASVLFAVASAHAVNLGWTASRHLLMSAVFSGLGVWLHVRQREAQSRAHPSAGVWLAWPPLVLGLGTSEASLGGIALILSYELLGRADSARARLLALAGPLLLGLGYLGFYALYGYGVHHSGLYLSPFDQPLAFAEALLSRLPILLGELFGALPASLWGPLPHARPILVGLGSLLLALVTALAVQAPGDQRRRLRWLGAGAIAAALPTVGGIPDGRMLVLASLAAIPVVASAIDGGFASPGPRRLTRIAAGTLLFLHLGCAAVGRIGVSLLLAHISDQQKALAQRADVSACPLDATGLIFTGADPSLSLSGATSLAYYRPEIMDQFRGIHVLSMAPQRQLLERSLQGTLTLTVLDPPRQVTLFEQLFRDEPLVPGYLLELPKLGAAVLETDRGLPTRVRFRVPEKSCLLTWQGGQLSSSPLPARGSSVTLEHEPGPYGL